MAKVKNISARAYGISGKIIAPLSESHELTDLELLSVQDAIDAGELELVGGKPAKAEKTKGKKETVEVAEVVDTVEVDSETAEIEAMLAEDNQAN